MGIDINRFVSKVPDALICSICNDVLDNPVQCPTNQHLFCLVCITIWLQDNSSCPLDREQLLATQLKPARLVNQLLEDYYVKCNFVGYGCQVVMKFGLINDHGDRCDFDHAEVIARNDRTINQYVEQVEMLQILLENSEHELEIANARLSSFLQTETEVLVDQVASDFDTTVQPDIVEEARRSNIFRTTMVSARSLQSATRKGFMKGLRKLSSKRAS